jgi:prepilin-type N-terminal cleavage/methylation domain-containing protein
MSTSGNSNNAFTLIELVLVLALLATIMAVSAPSLSRSFHGRNLEGQAAQVLAAFEYARSEAISQGIPMTVWINANTEAFGVQAATGYDGIASRNKTWTLHPEVRFDSTPINNDGNGHSLAATFQPEGTLDAASVDEIRLANQSGERISVEQTDDGNGYEIVK